MTKSHKIKKILTILQVVCILFVFIILFLNPKNNMQSFFKGIELWATLVMPALFPILFVTSILNSSGLSSKFGKILSPLTTRLFNCGGTSGYIYILSILSGYPVGAKVTSELYQKNIISQGEAYRITSFASTSGPLFILGTVGVGLFNSMRVGAIILISHLLGAFINGIIFRNLYNSSKYNSVSTYEIKRPESMLESCMLSSIKAIFIIGGYIAISYMIISLIEQYNIFIPISKFISKIIHVDYNIINGVMEGMIEMTKGVQNISLLNINENISAIISTGLISLGGLSIFLQAYTYLAKFKIKIRIYLFEKILHTAISIAICSILVYLF